MANLNPDCCGDHCSNSQGEVRMYPLGRGANLILCEACWEYENRYRRARASLGNPENWPILDWANARKE